MNTGIYIKRSQEMLKTIIEGEVADMFDEIVKVTDNKVLSWEYRLWPERTKSVYARM